MTQVIPPPINIQPEPDLSQVTIEDLLGKEHEGRMEEARDRATQNLWNLILKGKI